MKNVVKRWADVLFEPFYLQMYFITCSFLVEIPLIMAWVQWWKTLGLIWAALAILYDLCTRRRCLQSRGATLVLGLLAAYAVTTALVRIDYPYAFQETYLDLFCSAAALLVLYPPLQRRREQRMRLLNRLLILLTSAAAAAGIVMFLLHIGGFFYSDITKYDYPIGFADARLTGVYRNAIYPTPLIGAGAALMEWPCSKGVWRRLLLTVCLLLNCWHILLSNSRGLLYALVLLGGLATLFWIRRRLAAALSWKAWGAGALAAIALVGAMLGLAGPARRASGVLPVAMRQALAMVSPFSPKPTGGTDYEPPLEPEPVEEVDMEREIDENYGTLTGRPVIWRQGWNFFLDRPAFGYGPYALKDEVRIFPGSTERLSHFHNLFLHSLVSVGVVGSVFFFALLAVCVFRLLKVLFKGVAAPDYPALVPLAALLLSLLFLNLADVTLFFLSKNSEFVFWTYLGFVLPMTGDDPLKLDRPLQRLQGRLPRFGD